MEECYKVFRTHPDIQYKRDAIELLRVVADRRALNWIPDFLNHEDLSIQCWGIGIVDQLFYSELCYEEEIEELISIGINHENPYVHEKSEYIQSMIESTTE